MSDGRANSFLRIQDVFVLVSEMEKFLGVRNLLIEEEIRILVKMMKEKSNLPLYRKGLSTFLTTLVHFPSISEWLRARGNIQDLDLADLIRNHDAMNPNFHSARSSYDADPFLRKSETEEWKYGRQKNDVLDRDFSLRYRFQEQEFDQLRYKVLDRASRLLNHEVPFDRTKSESGLVKPSPKLDLLDEPRPLLEKSKTLSSSSPHIEQPSNPGIHDVPRKHDSPKAMAESARSTSKGWLSWLWPKKSKKVEFKGPQELHKEYPRNDELESIVESQRKLLRRQELLIHNLESKLYGGSVSFDIYRFLKGNVVTRRLPVIRDFDFSTISSVEAASKITLAIGAAMLTLGAFILGVFLTLKVVKLVIFILQEVTSFETGYSSDEEVQFSWIHDYPWLEYQVYNMYDTFGY